MQTTMEVTEAVLSEFVEGEVIFCNDNSGHSYLHKGKISDIKAGPEFTQIILQLEQSAVGRLDDRAEVTWEDATGPRSASSVTLRNPGAFTNDDTIVFGVPTDRGSTGVITRA